MKKSINEMENYESPSLGVFYIEVQQCIAASGEGNLNDWSEEDVPGEWEN